VDDLLLAGPTQEGCMEGTQLLLTLLWEAEYKVFQKKGPYLPRHHQHLVYHQSQGQHRLSPKRKQAVCSIPALKTHRQIREFLGATDFCHIWIPNYSLLAKPLYEATKQGEWEPLVWEKRTRESL
jgi:hypothetical protein